METIENRVVYLDNIRNFLVYNVVLLHIISIFAYPLSFWWAVIDQERASRFYETSLITMDIYLMPCLLFIASLFIFPSLKKSTAFEYIKNRLKRLYVPVIVFLFCAGDVFNQLRLKRLNSITPDYSETFLNFWGEFVKMPGIYLTSSQKTLNAVDFSFSHMWFSTLLFFITLVVVLLNLPLKRKNSEPKKVKSRKKIILQTIIFAVILGVVYAAAMIYYVIHQIDFGSWVIIGKVIQFNLNKIWILLPMFLFGLYAYQREWLTRGDIGNWKMWGLLAFIPLALNIPLFYIGILPTLNEMLKVIEHNMQFADKIAMPVVDASVQLSFLCSWVLAPAACVFLLMFFLSFAKRFFNKPNQISFFCSKHSINVYILHYIPVVILQYAFLNVPFTPIIKIILMLIIIIPACLWLSHRLVYPYPKIAISFFAALKIASLAAGFTFYYYALLILIFTSFAGALYESARFMVFRKTC